MLRGVSIAALLFALIVMAAPSMAQTTNGVISGIISDAQGGVLPGVTVTGRNAETGLMRTVVTEGDGRFRLAALPPGRYELKAELAGFGSVDVPPMTLTTGTEITRNVTMQVQGLNDSFPDLVDFLRRATTTAKVNMAANTARSFVTVG